MLQGPARVNELPGPALTCPAPATARPLTPGAHAGAGAEHPWEHAPAANRLPALPDGVWKVGRRGGSSPRATQDFRCYGWPGPGLLPWAGWTREKKTDGTPVLASAQVTNSR